jgi:hypothetical protein
LFTDTFPTLAQSGILAPHAKIWLPNMQCIQISLQDFKSELEPYFSISLEENVSLNPLYVATENAEDELLMCPDLITNKTQTIPLKNHAGSNSLFYVLELRSTFLLQPIEKINRKRRKTKE